jgi:hypothetical protein
MGLILDARMLTCFAYTTWGSSRSVRLREAQGPGKDLALRAIHENSV